MCPEVLDPGQPTTQPVLLIDDSHEDLFLVKRRLVEAGLKRPIMTIDDGEEAMAFLRLAIESAGARMVPCAIFCDVRMPRVGGFDLLKWIRNQPALTHTLFVVLTGGDVPEDRARAEQLGANHFLVKFPEAEVFKRILESLFGSSGTG
jgi:CheY-like chemotaxis protein